MTDGCLVKVDADYVIAPDGSKQPIVNWFDSDGQECAKEDAVVIVAGSEGHGFHVVDLRGLEKITVN